MENHILAVGGGGPAADLAEERGKTVVIRLAPALERVMMTLRTVHAHAEEKLRHVFQLLLGILGSLVPGNRRILHHGARGSPRASRTIWS